MGQIVRKFGSPEFRGDEWSMSPDSAAHRAAAEVQEFTSAEIEREMDELIRAGHETVGSDLSTPYLADNDISGLDEDFSVRRLPQQGEVDGSSN